MSEKKVTELIEKLTVVNKNPVYEEVKNLWLAKHARELLQEVEE